jgi:PAS domain S-box-containing protein
MDTSPLPDSIFRSLVHFAPDGFLVVDHAGVIVFANAQTEPLFGYARDELVGKPIERLIPQDLRAIHREHRADYREAPRARAMGSLMALRARRRDGSEFPVEVSLAPVYTDDGMFVSATVRDMSAQRHLEEERQRLLGEMQIQQERDRIAGDLHDGVMQTMYGVGLRLTGILARATGLSQTEHDEIEATIRELDAAIGDVRRYVQDLHPVEFDGNLRTSLERMVRVFDSDSAVRASFDCGVEACDLDQARGLELFLLVREALSNIRRHAEASSVTVRLDEEDGALILGVVDDGVGFDTSRSFDGHLGLPSMRRRALTVGAEFEVQSAPGDGTRVMLTVPLDSPPAPSTSGHGIATER